MKKHSGIVLKTCASDMPTMTVLDRQLGKIKGAVHQRSKNMRASHGAVITYLLTQRGTFYIFEVLDLEHVPFAFARQDIFFLHHLLELCYYFLPDGCAVSDVFDLLVHLFMQDNEKIWLQRRLIIVRLLMLFGVFPEHERISEYVDMICTIPLDRLLDIPVDQNMNRWLDQWIWGCLMEHPHKEQFKALWLLKRAESHES